MVWAKLDDEILDNPKIAKVGVLGFALHVAAITWCCRNLTDGFVPEAKVDCILNVPRTSRELLENVASKESVPGGLVERLAAALFETGDPHAGPIVDSLVEAGLWREVPGGYQLHDFLVYNPTKEKVLADRAAAKERRSGKRIDSDITRTSDKRNKNVTRTSSERAANVARSSDCPVPVPVPIKTKEGDPVLELVTEPETEPDPANTNSKTQKLRQREERWRDALAAGISQATGTPCKFGDEPWQQRSLANVITVHAPKGLKLEALDAWLTSSGKAYGLRVKSTQGTVSLKGFEAWHNSGRPGPLQRIDTTGRPEVAQMPYHAPWSPPEDEGEAYKPSDEEVSGILDRIGGGGRQSA